MHAELDQDGLYAGTGGAAGYPIAAAISAVRSPAGSRASTSTSRRVRLAGIQLAQVRLHPPVVTLRYRLVTDGRVV